MVVEQFLAFLNDSEAENLFVIERGVKPLSLDMGSMSTVNSESGKTFSYVIPMIKLAAAKNVSLSVYQTAAGCISKRRLLQR